VIPRESQVGFVIFRPEDQTFIGWAGCQQVDDGYRVDGEHLQVEAVTLTDSRCYRPRFDHMGDRFAQALRSVITYRLADDDARLELMTDRRITAMLWNANAKSPVHCCLGSGSTGIHSVFRRQSCSPHGLQLPDSHMPTDAHAAQSECRFCAASGALR
jgi:hypothetical protein